MTHVYPKALEGCIVSFVKKEIKKLNKKTVANSIIEYMDVGCTKSQAIGSILNGSDDVETFNEVWNAIETEGKALRSVKVDGTEASYKTALEDKTTYLDSLKFYAGLKAEKEVSTWSDLKALFEPAEV